MSISCNWNVTVRSGQQQNVSLNLDTGAETGGGLVFQTVQRDSQELLECLPAVQTDNCHEYPTLVLLTQSVHDEELLAVEDNSVLVVFLQELDFFHLARLDPDNVILNINLVHLTKYS